MKTRRITEMAEAFWKDEEGVTAIEYALIAALIAIVIAASVGLAGQAVSDLFERVAAGFP